MPKLNSLKLTLVLSPKQGAFANLLANLPFIGSISVMNSVWKLVLLVLRTDSPTPAANSHDVKWHVWADPVSASCTVYLSLHSLNSSLSSGFWYSSLELGYAIVVFCC